MTASFAASYACLCLAQGATVAAPRLRVPALERLRSPLWALVPVASIVAVVVAIRAAGHVADALTWLALIATPPLAFVALAALAPRRRLVAALAIALLFALAWADRGGLPGEAAALVLTALGCATLGALLVAVAPSLWLKFGIVAMAAADTALVVSQLLQRPNNRLNAVAPPAGLPQLQRAELGDALMGYGDLFLAAVLGALLLRERRRQGTGALLTAGLALAFGVLFLWVHILPATVPVAVALIVSEAWPSRAAGGRH